MNRPPRIAVLGSINMDLVVRCGRLPRPGETSIAESHVEICGGKGANQAVAAARAGGDVTMIGRVGDDAFADRLRANLISEGIHCEWVQTTSGSASGLATVWVEQSGQNSILVVPGANAKLSVADVRAAKSVIESCDILLLQLEVPLVTVTAAIEVARRAGVRIILDPAPAPIECPTKLLDVDLICPNESEAAAISGISMDTNDELNRAVRELHRRGASHVAITLGERGTLLSDGETSQFVDAVPAKAVDTTAAGDAFAGAIAVHWAENNRLLDAVQFANAAGAWAVSRKGAQPGMGTRIEIEKTRDSIAKNGE